MAPRADQDGALADAGLDIAHPFDAAEIAREPGLAALGAHGRLGILVGNTRALWPRFLAARRADPELAAARDPLERYVEAALARACAGRADVRVFFGHRRYAGAFLPFQRLAVAAGLGALAPTHLVIHPIYGPWFALRAVIVGPGEPPSAPAAAALPCTCGAPCSDAIARATASGSTWRDWLAVRDACPIGRDWRYDDAQLRYHYTKDPAALI